MWHVCVFVGLCLNLRELGNVFAKTYWVVAQPACAASAFAEPDKDFKLPTSQGQGWKCKFKSYSSIIAARSLSRFLLLKSIMIVCSQWVVVRSGWSLTFGSYVTMARESESENESESESVRGGWSLTFGSYVTLARPVGKPISYNCASFTTPFQSALRTTALTRNPRMR